VYADFSFPALHRALEVHRRDHSLTWAQVGRSIGVSPATIQRLCHAEVMEADGILRMLHWLNRSVESFCPGSAEDPAAKSTRHDSGIPRVDALAVHAALEARRSVRQLPWSAVAAAVGAAPAQLTRLRDGGRVEFRLLLRAVDWLDEPLARFIKRTPR
jgi:hypothetical protein